MKILYSKTAKYNTDDIKEKVRTFENACEVLGIDKVEFGITGLDEDKESIEAYSKLVIIAKALNEGWQPDWNDGNQYKYVPYFKHNPGFGLSFGGYDGWLSSAFVCFRLCFKTKELAEYAAIQFADIYNSFLSIK